MTRLTDLGVWLLFIHVGSALVGLGPSFIYVKIGQAGRQEPAHAMFAMRLSRALSTRWTHPLALVVLVSGAVLIWYMHYDLLATRWLLLSVILYVISFLYASFVQNRDLARVLDLMEAGPPDSLTDEQRAQMATRRTRIRYGGMFMRTIVLVVLFLMIAKPSF